MEPSSNVCAAWARLGAGRSGRAIKSRIQSAPLRSPLEGKGIYPAGELGVSRVKRTSACWGLGMLRLMLQNRIPFLAFQGSVCHTQDSATPVALRRTKKVHGGGTLSGCISVASSARQAPQPGHPPVLSHLAACAPVMVLYRYVLRKRLAG